MRSLSCVRCNLADESLDHILTACPFSMEVWDLIGSWCKVNLFYAFHVHDLYTFHYSRAGDKNWKKMLNAIILIAIWSLWKSRNDAVHNMVFSTAHMIFEEIRSMAFLWIPNRAKKVELDWDSWCSKPCIS
uniref:uncharacterized protein LOC122601101 n=1 Tax=Erigeron canadensis TaxID=72917 RepID=UPI001CB924D2|nr:uncharacterized protein LOC122601101 [Erigeron canadensis]